MLMVAESPFDGKKYYFIDKCLPFGASISCAHFQAFSNVILHIVKFKTGKHNVNYLDDFLFVTLLKALCNGQLDTFLDVCRKINFPVSMEKTFRACTQMTFLGFLINSMLQLVMVPAQKVAKEGH